LGSNVFEVGGNAKTILWGAGRYQQHSGSGESNNLKWGLPLETAFGELET
jgi:hypothetical protein